MRAGRLKHSVTIQSTTETRGTAGGVVNTWGTFAKRRASVVPLNGSEYIESMSTQERASTRIRMRYLAGVTAKMRVLWGTRVYDILHVINTMEKDKETILMCNEIL